MKNPHAALALGFAISLLFFAAGCGTEWEYGAVPIDEATLLHQHDLRAHFRVSGSWGDTSGEFSNCMIEREGNAIAIKMYGKTPEAWIRRPAVVPISGTCVIAVEEPGAYTLSFWRGTEEPIVREVVFE